MQTTLFDSVKGINILPYDGEALFYPEFLGEDESNHYFNQLQKDYTFTQWLIRIYDKDVLHPRLTAFCGDPGDVLDYSEESMSVQPWTPDFIVLKEKAEAVAGV